MAMTLREQNALLNRIVWGGFYARVLNAKQEPLFLIIKELTLKDRAWVDFIYQQAILEAKDQGLMPRAELAVFLSKQGLWTDKDEEELKNLAKGLNNLDGKLLEKLTKNEYKKILRAKSLVEMTYKELSRKRADLFSSSAERYSEEQRIKAIVYCSAYNIDNTKLWPSWDAFQNETDIELIDNILAEVSKTAEITTEEFRALARSNSWRFKWQASKNCDDLFGKPIVELSGSQESLIYWSQVYDSVYEAYERPPDDIIDDDEALDEWFEEQSKKRKREQLEASSKSKSSKVGTERVWRHGEIGIVTNEALEADLKRAEKLGLAKRPSVMTNEQVEDLNDPLAKKFKQAQRNKLKEMGVAREEDIRSDSNSRRVIGASDAILKKHRRPDGFTGRSAVRTYSGGTLKGRRNE